MHHQPYSREVLPARIAAPAFPPIGRGGTQLFGNAEYLPLFGGVTGLVNKVAAFGKSHVSHHLSAALLKPLNGPARRIFRSLRRQPDSTVAALSPFGMVPDHVAKVGACGHATRQAARSGLVARLSARVLAGASCPGSFWGAA